MSRQEPSEVAERHVALLRGINVGGHNKLPMKQLAGIFEQVGCRDVRTYIQSGNVVFGADAELARRIPAIVPAAIGEALGFEPPIVLRSAAELARVVERNPYLEQADDPKRLHVAFLADTPTPDEVARLDPDRSPPDRFTVTGREIYLHCPNGMARTKLTNAYFDSKLSTLSTLRNWRTTLKLLEIARA